MAYEGRSRFGILQGRLRALAIIIGITLAVGILLEILPPDLLISKPLHLLELDLEDMRIEWRDRTRQILHGEPVSHASPIALVLIHERAFDEYGFPVSRGTVADVIHALSGYGARVVGLGMTFDLTQEEDELLAAVIRSVGNTILPVVMTGGQSMHSAQQSMEPEVPAYAYLRLQTEGTYPQATVAASRLPVRSLLSSAMALGHINTFEDQDVRIRRLPAAIPDHSGGIYLSLSLMAICQFYDVPPEGIRIEWRKQIVLDNLKEGNERWHRTIPIDQDGCMHINYSRRLDAFTTYSFSHVHRAWQSIPGLHGSPIRPDDLEGKIVFVGYLDERSEQTATPLETGLPAVAMHATIAESIMQASFIRRAGRWPNLLVRFFVTLMTTLLLMVPGFSPQRRPQFAYGISVAFIAGILLSFVLVNFVVFYVAGVFVEMAAPIALIVLASFATLGYRYVAATEGFIQRLGEEQTQLRHQKAYNDLILERMANGLIAVDQQYQITTVNPKAAELLGMDVDEAVGRSVEEVFGTSFPDLAARLTLPLHEAGQPLELRTDTSEVNISFSLGSREGSPRQHRIMVLTDVTEIHRLERESQFHQKRAAYAQLASELNHRIKNRLATIKLAVSQLMELVNLTESGKPIVERIDRQIARLETVGRDFQRGVSTYDQALDGQWSESGLNELTQTALTDASTRISSDIHIQTHFESPLPPIRLEFDWLRDAVQNLIHNAIEAMPGGGTLTLTTQSLPSGQVLLSIKDTGEGISEVHKPHIFVPWFTRKEHGTGMGLYMVQQVMLAHNGTIEFDSTEGEGTVFRLVFPAVSEPHHPSL